jgi:hypothetical protein
MIVNYDRNCNFIVLATVITIVNYDCKTFIVQATNVVSAASKLKSILTTGLPHQQRRPRLQSPVVRPPSRQDVFSASTSIQGTMS